MNASSLAGHAVELLEKVVVSALPSDRVVKDFFKERRYLGSHDRRWITERLYGMIRNFILLRELTDHCVDHALPIHVFIVHEMMIGGMGIEEVENAYPALLEAYRMSGRKLELDSIRECTHDRLDEIKGSPGSAPLLFSFPDFFGEELPENVREESVPLMIALNKEARVCIRVDTNRIGRKDVLSAFADEGIQAEPARFSPLGIYLPKRINLNNNRLYKGGFIEIQEEASQLVGLLVNPHKDEIIVDACAGAGGKSLEIAALSNGECKIYALDVDETRLRNLAVRTRRGGYSDVFPIRVSASDLGEASALSGTADKVVVDAPCSGSGTIRRNPDKKLRLTKQAVEKHASYQSSLLARYSNLVKVGGIIVYSTCSMFQSENSGVVSTFLESNENFIPEDVSHHLTDDRYSELIENGRLVIYPHKHEMDGFFAAVMKRVS